MQGQNSCKHAPSTPVAATDVQTPLTRGLPTEYNEGGFATNKELDGLMSVVDHASETESKMTQLTNQH